MNMHETETELIEKLNGAQAKIAEMENREKASLLEKVEDEETRKRYERYDIKVLRTLLAGYVPKQEPKTEPKPDFEWEYATWDEKFAYARQNKLTGAEILHRETTAIQRRKLRKQKF